MADRASAGTGSFRTKANLSDRLWPWAMVGPALAFLVAVVIVPIVFLVITALYRHNLFQATPPRYVGFDNFYYLFRSARFHTAVGRMFAYAAIALTAEMVLGFLLAAWIFRLRNQPGMGIVRTLLTTPILIAPVVAAVMWRFMYQPDFGIFNAWLTEIGLPRIGWLSNPSLALISVAIIDVWQWTPFVFLILLSGMYAIPQNLYEAAELDGAGTVRSLVFITIPLLKRVLVIVFLLRAIDLLRAFETIVATTQGGPGAATYTLPVMIWETAFVNFQVGDAAAASLVLLVIVSIAITLLLRMVSRESRVAGSRA
ncbi:MAG TPA: sugar ABC transporter permease [Bauldia sp.]|nr:sugar ABC transporter permease [Bauldia sp.]